MRVFSTVSQDLHSFFFLLASGSDFSPLLTPLSWEESAGGARGWIFTSEMKAEGGLADEASLS